MNIKTISNDRDFKRFHNIGLNENGSNNLTSLKSVFENTTNTPDYLRDTYFQACMTGKQRFTKNLDFKDDYAEFVKNGLIEHIKFEYYLFKAIEYNLFAGGDIHIKDVTDDGDDLFIWKHSAPFGEVYVTELYDNGEFLLDDGSYEDTKNYDEDGYSVICYQEIDEEVLRDFNPQFKQYLIKNGVQFDNVNENSNSRLTSLKSLLEDDEFGEINEADDSKDDKKPEPKEMSDDEIKEKAFDFAIDIAKLMSNVMVDDIVGIAGKVADFLKNHQINGAGADAFSLENNSEESSETPEENTEETESTENSEENTEENNEFSEA